jgi:hypothetical protein
VTLQIDIPPELETQLAAKAQAAGTSPEQLIPKVLEREFAAPNQASVQPFRSYRGALAKYGAGPSAADIDQNRR